MSDQPTDEQITRALATKMAGVPTEQPGWPTEQLGWSREPPALTYWTGCVVPVFSPLTSWADLGPLMEEYSVCTTQTHIEQGQKYWDAFVDEHAAVQIPDLKRAICLALYYSIEDEKR